MFGLTIVVIKLFFLFFEFVTVFSVIALELNVRHKVILQRIGPQIVLQQLQDIYTLNTNHLLENITQTKQKTNNKWNGFAPIYVIKIKSQNVR